MRWERDAPRREAAARMAAGAGAGAGARHAGVDPAIGRSGSSTGLIRQSYGWDGGGGMVVPSLQYCLKD
jgi:hypothetical protein